MTNLEELLLGFITNLKPLVTVDNQWTKCAVSLYQHPSNLESLIVVTIPYDSKLDLTITLSSKDAYASYVWAEYETGKSHFIIK